MANARHVTHIGHIDCPGGGQVWVDGNILCVGHMRGPAGTSLYDIADPARGRASSRMSSCRRGGIRTRSAPPTA